MQSERFPFREAGLEQIRIEIDLRPRRTPHRRPLPWTGVPPAKKVRPDEGVGGAARRGSPALRQLAPQDGESFAEVTFQAPERNSRLACDRLVGLSVAVDADDGVPLLL